MRVDTKLNRDTRRQWKRSGLLILALALAPVLTGCLSSLPGLLGKVQKPPQAPSQVNWQTQSNTARMEQMQDRLDSLEDEVSWAQSRSENMESELYRQQEILQNRWNGGAPPVGDSIYDNAAEGAWVQGDRIVEGVLL